MGLVRHWRSDSPLEKQAAVVEATADAQKKCKEAAEACTKCEEQTHALKAQHEEADARALGAAPCVGLVACSWVPLGFPRRAALVP